MAKKSPAKTTDTAPFDGIALRQAPSRVRTTVTQRTFYRDGNGRIQMSLGEGFDATDTDRTRRTRTAVDSGADAHMARDKMTKLREMARDYDRNSGLVHGVLDRFASHVVGPKLVFEPTTTNDGWNKEAKTWFSDHIGPSCDAREMLSLRDNLSLTLRAMGTDGDQLKIFLKDFQIQTVEAHLIATPNDLLSVDATSENIVNGVRLNAKKAATGFWVSKESVNGYFANHRDGRLIRTTNALWPAYRTRTSQTRGVPVVASALSCFDRLSGYIEAEMLAAQVDASVTFWITRNQDFNAGELEPGQTEQIVGTADGSTTTEKLQSIKPMAIYDMAENESIQSIGGKRPGDQFEPFIVAGMRMFGAALGFPLELVLLDFSKTNYSSARAAVLEACKFVFEGWQKWLEDYLATPIYRRWIFQAMALGELPFNPEWRNVKWFWPKYPYIDPLKSALAVREAIAGGWHSITRELARDGIRIEDHITERAAELELFRANKIPTTTAEGATVAGKVDPLTLKVLTEGDKEEAGANE